MSDHENPEGELSPAERRLSEHLDLLRASPPSATPELIGRIIRQARWQRAIRGPLVLVGAVASAFADGLGLLLRRSAGRR
jgi:hypothetical protein